MTTAAATPSILRRFPSHLGADQPGKLVGAVVDALAGELEVATTELGRVQRSRRLAEAAELADLLHLAGLHGIEGHALELLRQRLAAAAITDDATLLALMRARIQTVIAQHRRGNGTVRALLGAAANAVDLDVRDIRHSEDGYWHAALCADRLPATTGDVVLLEENPDTPSSLGPVALRHGGQLTVPRRGYEAAAVTISVAAIGERTVAPMVVNVDTGVGLAFTDALADGETLVYANDGTRTSPTIRGAATSSSPAKPDRDVGASCYWFSGGVFAGSVRFVEDFVFADDVTKAAPGHDNVATWATTIAPGSFDNDHPLPSRDKTVPDLPAVFMPAGTARWALFVAAGTFAADGDAGALPASPQLLAARFGRSVWDPEQESPVPHPVGALGLAWHEHEPFKVDVWLPERLEALDADDQPKVADRVGNLLERHRAAGVKVEVGYAGDIPAGRLPADLTAMTKEV